MKIVHNTVMGALMVCSCVAQEGKKPEKVPQPGRDIPNPFEAFVQITETSPAFDVLQIGEERTLTFVGPSGSKLSASVIKGAGAIEAPVITGSGTASLSVKVKGQATSPIAGVWLLIELDSQQGKARRLRSFTVWPGASLPVRFVPNVSHTFVYNVADPKKPDALEAFGVTFENQAQTPTIKTEGKAKSGAIVVDKGTSMLSISSPDAGCGTWRGPRPAAPSRAAEKPLAALAPRRE